MAECVLLGGKKCDHGEQAGIVARFYCRFCGDKVRYVYAGDAAYHVRQFHIEPNLERPDFCSEPLRSLIMRIRAEAEQMGVMWL